MTDHEMLHGLVDPGWRFVSERYRELEREWHREYFGRFRTTGGVKTSAEKGSSEPPVEP